MNQHSRSLKTVYKLYQFWTGNNKFCLDGKCLNGLKNSSSRKYICLLVCLGSFVLYMTFPAFHIYRKISPYLTLLTVYTFLITVFFYFLTVTQSIPYDRSDPGLIPRRQFLQLKRLRTNHRIQGKYFMVYNNYGKKCRTCRIYRPH